MSTDVTKTTRQKLLILDCANTFFDRARELDLDEHRQALFDLIKEWAEERGLK